MKYFTKFIPTFHIENVELYCTIPDNIEYIKEGDYINLTLIIFLNNFSQGNKYSGTFKVTNPIYSIKEEYINSYYVEKIYNLLLNENQKEDIRCKVNTLQKIKEELNKNK